MPLGGLTCQPPFRPALLEAPRLPTRRLQAADGVVRVGAERAAAVGDDLAVGRQLGEPVLELIDRDRARACDVTGLELLGRAHVYQYDVALAQPSDQLVASDRADVVAEVVACGALDVGELGDGRVAQRQPQ